MLISAWPDYLGEGPRGPRLSFFFSCIFKTFLYDPYSSNRPLSVVIIIQSGFNFIQFRPPLSEYGRELKYSR